MLDDIGYVDHYGAAGLVSCVLVVPREDALSLSSIVWLGAYREKL